MSQPTRDDGVWVNSALVTENFNKFPAEELLKYSGLHVAFTLDGSRIVASAATGPELEETVKKLGLDPSRVIFAYME